MRVLVLLNLHTYTPCQLLIRARNRSDVCSRNRPNPLTFANFANATRKRVMSNRKASTGRVNAELTSMVQRLYIWQTLLSKATYKDTLHTHFFFFFTFTLMAHCTSGAIRGSVLLKNTSAGNRTSNL